VDTVLIRRLLPLVLGLLWASPVRAAVAFVQNPTAGNPGSVTTCTTGSATWTGGNVIVIVAAIRTATSTVSSITQSAGSNTYTFESAASGNNTVRVEMWTAINIAGGTFTISVNLSASSKVVCAAAEYSGVGSFANATFTTASVANPSFNVTVSANSWCSAGFVGQGTGTFTAGGGTNLRGNAVSSGGSASSNVGGAQVDAGPVGVPPCTVSVTNSDTTWALGGIELVPGGAGPTCTNFIALLGAGCQ